MKITLTGSLGNISKPLAKTLLNAGHQVTIISSDAGKIPAIEALGAKAAIGSITDVAFLTAAYTDADVVYTMVPPSLQANNFRAHVGGIGKNYAEAIKQAGIKRIVNLSSIGAHLNDGIGPIKGSHDVEATLNALEGVAVKHIRAGFFYTNLYGNVEMIKSMGILGSNYDSNTRLVMVHPEDIADAVAEELQNPFTGKSVRYITSDDTITGKVAAALGAAIGKPGLPWIEFSDEQALNGMLQGGMSPEMAKNLVEMGMAVRSGILWEDYDQHKPAAFGKTNLETFAKEFAERFEG